MPGTAHEEKLQEFDEFEVEAVAGWKYIEGRQMYLVTWADCKKRSRV